MDGRILANLLIFVIVMVIFSADVFIKLKKMVHPYSSDIYFYSDIIILILLTYLLFKTESMNKKIFNLFFMIFLIMMWINNQIITKNVNNDKLFYFYDGALASYAMSNMLF